MKTIRKEEVVDRIAARIHEPKTTVWRVLDTFIDVVAEALANQERVHIARFGTFDLRHYPQRVGVHPRTRDPLLYPERYAPSFRSSVTLKRRVRVKPS
jgi:DNA-binding protein HU-beta